MRVEIEKIRLGTEQGREDAEGQEFWYIFPE